MDYPKLWERIGAALIDWLLYTVFTLVLLTMWKNFAFHSTGLLRFAGFLGGVLNVALIVGFKVLFESGKLQATPGKIVFGLQVVDAEGLRPTPMRALLRCWPWSIFLIPAITDLLLVGYWINGIVWLGLLAIAFTMILPPGGRALHDITSGLFVMKTGPGMIGR